MVIKMLRKTLHGIYVTFPKRINLHTLSTEPFGDVFDQLALQLYFEFYVLFIICLVGFCKKKIIYFFKSYTIQMLIVKQS